MYFGKPYVPVVGTAMPEDVVLEKPELPGVAAWNAALDLAGKDLERQRQLFQQNYISRAALERAEAEFRSTQAQVNAQGAQAGAANISSPARAAPKITCRMTPPARTAHPAVETTAERL